MENNSAYSEFESLWQKANNPQQDTQAVEVGSVDSNAQSMFLLPHFTNLADSLKSQEIIDDAQYKQMADAIAQLRDVIKTIDHQVLSDVIESLNKA